MAEMTMNEAAAKLHELAQETVSEETPEEIPEEPEQEQETSEAVSDDQDVNLEEEEPIDQESEVEEEAPGAETIELEADQFAEALNLKPEQLIVDDEGVKFKATPKGSEPVDVTLDQLLNAYQGEATLTNRSKEIANLEKQQQEHLQRLAEQSNQFAQQSATILEALKDKFVNPYDDAELKALREDDPAEYAARKQEINERENEFKQLVNQALGTVQNAGQVQNEEVQRQYQQYLQAEHEKTLKAIPDWGKVAEKVADYSKNSLGFTDEEIGQIADSRILIALHDSMTLRKGKEGAKQKKVRTVPKVMKSGPRPSKDQVSIEAAEKARQRLKQSGSMDDAVAALRATRRR